MTLSCSKQGIKEPVTNAEADEGNSSEYQDGGICCDPVTCEAPAEISA